MSRTIFQGIFRDAQGNTIDTGTVTVFNAGTTTASTLYVASAGGTSVTTVDSDSYGYFCFYVDSTDYPLGTELFDITLSKTGYVSQTYEDVLVNGFLRWDKDYDDLINSPDIDDLLPAQTAASGKVLGSNGTNALWLTYIPTGGTDGQVLTKATGTDYDTAWEAIPESASIIETQVFM